MSRSRSRSLMFAVAITAYLIVVQAASAFAQSTFSLSIQFRDAATDALKSDGAPYVDLAEKRVPAVYSSGGAIALDLKGSLRTMYLAFPSDAMLVQYGPANLLPLAGAFPVEMQTLISTYGGITDLTAGSTDTFSAVFYWKGPGADGALHDYSVAFRQRNNDSGVRATADANGTTWTVTTRLEAADAGRVSVNVGGRNGGWKDLADYQLPFGFTAVRLVPNLRGGKK